MAEGDFYEEISRHLLPKPEKEKGSLRSGPLTKAELGRLKLSLCKRHRLKKIPTDIEIMLRLSSRPEAKDKAARRAMLLRLSAVLQTKPVRSLAGVNVVAVMTKPAKCPHGRCIMCPGGIGSVFGDVPQSYTGEEPATRRAKRNKYDPYLQVFNRLEQYIASGHSPEKAELIIMGGTFPSHGWRYQKGFVALCLKAMNDFSREFYKRGEIDIKRYLEFFLMPSELKSDEREKEVMKRVRELKGKASPSLKKEQKRNESSAIRCVGLTAETRPDFGRERQAIRLLELGATRVELGVQSVFDSVLDRIGRGHTAKDSKDSIRILKDLGFKINIHYMPGLASDAEEDLEGMRMLFKDPGYRPDMLKIYPCAVIRGTELYKQYRQGRYRPLSTDEAARLIARFKPGVPEYCRIMRVARDIPRQMVSAGVDRTNLRQYVEGILSSSGKRCRCIRCREPGRVVSKAATSGLTKARARIRTIRYEASGGTEFFISEETASCIIGFCRLRLPGTVHKGSVDDKSALVRELHVYGSAIGVGKRQEQSLQHRGTGRRLLKAAERTAKSAGKDRMVVISGIGARGYYRKLGYRKAGPYMVRKLF